MEKNEICMDWKPEDAKAVLMQAMMDEAIRLRQARSSREREEIRRFLVVACEAIQSNENDNIDREEC